jgi:hypothetical protein
MSYIQDPNNSKKQTFSGFSPTTKQKNAFNVNNDFYSSDDASYKATLQVKTVDVTMATGATDTDVASFFPAGCVPLSLTITVTTALTNDGYISKVGTDGDADMIADSIGDGVLEDAGDTLSFQGGGVVADTATWFAAADALRLTTNAANSGGGAVRVSMFYVDGTNL